jgi:anti-sigma B factor antagonist
MSVEVNPTHHNGSPVLSLAGELDLSQVPAAEQALRSIEREKPGTLVIDLSGLTFIDSSGLRLVLEADQRARRDGRRLFLIQGPDAVQRVFLIALLDKRLAFIRDLSELQSDHESD